MFNLYLHRGVERAATSSTGPRSTGHDRFTQLRPAHRRNKKHLQQQRANRDRRKNSQEELELETVLRWTPEPGNRNGGFPQRPHLSSSRSPSPSLLHQLGLRNHSPSSVEEARAYAPKRRRGEDGEEYSVPPTLGPPQQHHLDQLRQEAVRVEGAAAGNGMVTASLDSLARLFSCVSLGRTRRQERIANNNMHGHGGRYSYSALEDEGAGERLELERKAARGASRETASLAARSYVRTQPRYSIIEHLPDVGSRIDKNWFLVKDTTVKTERLMTLLPYDEACPIPLAQGTREALIELFQALQHPYIYPVLDMDFASISNHCYVISVLPYNQKGTLKDLIYRSHWQEDWGEKYQQRSSGLPVSQVQRLGRQVLEALLFLQDRGFPPCGHVHSGNIILQNGVARLSGIENTLLGLTSRIYPIIRKRLRDNRDAIDSVSFGHVLFEMCAGYELSAAHPTLKHLEDIAGYPQVLQVLDFIFGSGEQYPSIEEILCLDFFRNLDLREMRAMPIPNHMQARYSPLARNILREVRRHQKQRKRGRRGGGGCSSTGGGEGGSPTPPSTEAAAAASTAGGSSGSTAATGDTSGWRGDSEEASAALQSSYTTPSASLAALTSPSSDVTPSPEHPTHRFLEVSSPTRQLASSCSSSTQQEVYHTPPHTPPTPQNHPIKSNLMNHHHHHHTHNDRPLLTTNRYPPKASSSPTSSPRGVYWSSLQHNHHHQQHHHSPQHHHHSPQHHQQQQQQLHAGENGQTSCSSGGSSGSSGQNFNNNNNATKRSGSSYPWT